MSRRTTLCVLAMTACTEYQPVPIDVAEPDVHTLARATFAEATPFEMRLALGTVNGQLRNTLDALVEDTDADATVVPEVGRPYAPEFSGCPELTVMGNLGWYHADGCDHDQWRTYDGELYVENVFELDLPRYEALAAGNFDHERLASFVFSDWSRSTALSDIEVDGQVWWTRALVEGKYVRVDGYRIDRTLGDRSWREDVSTRQSCQRYLYNFDLCRFDAGSEAAVSGLGRYGIEGLLRSEAGKLYGTVLLTGEDQVRFDFDATVMGCVPYEVSDGTTGEVCE